MTLNKIKNILKKVIKEQKHDEINRSEKRVKRQEQVAKKMYDLCPKDGNGNCIYDQYYYHSKIYKITNIKDDEIYVGATIQDLKTRFLQHKTSSKNSKKANLKLYKHMNLIGCENFKIELVENYPCNNMNELEDREYYWANKLNASLNTYYKPHCKK